MEEKPVALQTDGHPAWTINQRFRFGYTLGQESQYWRAV